MLSNAACEGDDDRGSNPGGISGVEGVDRLIRALLRIELLCVGFDGAGETYNSIPEGSTAGGLRDIDSERQIGKVSKPMSDSVKDRRSE